MISVESVDELLNAAVYDENIVNLKKAFRQEENMDFNKIMEDQGTQADCICLEKRKDDQKSC